MAETETQLDRIRHPKKRAFLILYSQIGVVLRAARAAQVSRATVYHWLQNDDEFRQAYEDVGELVTELIVDSAVERSIYGSRRIKYHDGKPVIDPHTGRPYEEITYETALTIFMLKKHAPEKYGDDERVPDGRDVVIHIERDGVHGHPSNQASNGAASPAAIASASGTVQDRQVGPSLRQDGSGPNGSHGGARSA